MKDIDECHLQAHTQPWKSACDDPKLARSLLMQDDDAGFAYILTGGFAAATQHWGEILAAGRKAMEASVAQTAGASFKSGRGCLVCMACKDFCQCVREDLNEVSKGLDALL